MIIGHLVLMILATVWRYNDEGEICAKNVNGGTEDWNFKDHGEVFEGLIISQWVL